MKAGVLRWVSIAVTAFFGWLAPAQEGNAKSENLLSPKEFQQQHKARGGELIDVRKPEEYKEGHLKGARLINFYDKDFKDRITSLPKDKTYFVYCRSARRSGVTAKMLKEAGFNNVYDLAGGILLWAKQGLPVVKEKQVVKGD